MENRPSDCSFSDEDLRAALEDMKTYVDVTEEDLRKIYQIALRYARRRSVLQMPVSEAMTGNVVSVSPDASLDEAAGLLSENRISGMPVVDRMNRVIGVISESDLLLLAGMRDGHTFRDVLRRIMGESVPGREPGGKVGNAMSAPPVTIRADDEVRNAAHLLNEKRIKRLPVVDDDGKLTGIISTTDIVRLIGANAHTP